MLINMGILAACFTDTETSLAICESGYGFGIYPAVYLGR